MLPYVKEMTSPSLMNEMGHSKPVHCDNPERWGGEGCGRGVHSGERRYTHGWFMSTYGKNHHNIVKQLPSYWNKKQTKNFSCGTVVKESACDVGFLGLIPGWGRSPEEGIDNSLQCSCLENCMYRAACWTIYMGYIAHGVSKSPRQLSDFLSLFHFSWIKLSKIVKPQVIAYADI